MLSVYVCVTFYFEFFAMVCFTAWLCLLVFTGLIVLILVLVLRCIVLFLLMFCFDNSVDFVL